mmetsp:Transcript_31788/g.90288  ORF Transcript_31788/g.90288 Transcript_31788/m.90288 type:complete len:156 (+) Transcript_31788:816-1283(+)
MHNPIGIDVECHLNLWHTAGGWGDADQVELAEQLVVGGHLSLSLENLDPNLGLAVGSGGEHLGLLRWDGCVPVNEAGEDTSHGLNAEAQRGHIEQQDVLHVTAQHSALDRGTHGNHLIGVDTPVGILVEDFLHDFVDLWHAGHAAHKQDLIDVVC